MAFNITECANFSMMPQLCANLNPAIVFPLAFGTVLIITAGVVVAKCYNRRQQQALANEAGDDAEAPRSVCCRR